jgi:gluconate 5-dehydrogenase
VVQKMFDLTGRIALVTGSSRGIGHAYAEALVEAGAETIINGRHEAELEAARTKLAAGGGKVHARVFDVSDREAVNRAIEAIETDIGPIDILFNNAGIQRRAPLADYDPDTWRELMAINLDSVFYVGQAVGRRMVERKRGKIVNTCSLNSEIARPTIAPYATSKGGVKMLTKAMCVEWASHGIQVNGIGPGFFKTELNKPLYTDPDFDSWLKRRAPAGRWGEVDELKGVAVFLASDASNYVNGQIIYVDGGFLSEV